MYIVRTFYKVSKQAEAYFSCKKHLPTNDGMFSIHTIKPVDFRVDCQECKVRDVRAIG